MAVRQDYAHLADHVVFLCLTLCLELDSEAVIADRPAKVLCDVLVVKHVAAHAAGLGGLLTVALGVMAVVAHFLYNTYAPRL